jgi:Tol biopolymer transport system component
MITLLIAGAKWLFPLPKNLHSQQLTNASPERIPHSVALSPDGKYLTFADRTGAYIQVVGSTEVHPILSLNGFQVSHISWGADSTTVVACATRASGETPALFVTSIFTADAPRQLAANSAKAAVSWTGDRIAYLASSGAAIWIVGIGGDNPRQIFQTADGERITELAWAPDSQSVVVSKLSGQDVHYQIELLSVDISSKRLTSMLQDPMLQGFSIARTGRLVASIASSGRAATLYESHIDTSYANNSRFRKLGVSGAQALYAMSMSADGRRLVFLQGNYQSDAFVGSFDQERHELRDVKRVTMDDRNDFPTAWTPSADAIIHHSERNGHYAILKQPLTDSAPIPIVIGSGDYRSARITPDGQYLLYEARPTDWLSSRLMPAKLMLVPIQGGSPKELLARFAPFSVRCSQTPARTCLLMERELHQLVFYRLDPTLGLKEVVAREPVPLGLRLYNWDLSPDGTTVALVHNTGGSVIRTIGIRSGARNDIAVTDSLSIQSLDWTPDGSGWIVSSPSVNGSTLYLLRRSGEIYRLRDQPGSLISWAIPSRDGHFLVILQWTVTSNAWMIDDL